MQDLKLDSFDELMDSYFFRYQYLLNYYDAIKIQSSLDELNQLFESVFNDININNGIRAVYFKDHRVNLLSLEAKEISRYKHFLLKGIEDNDRQFGMNIEPIKDLLMTYGYNVSESPASLNYIYPPVCTNEQALDSLYYVFTSFYIDWEYTKTKIIKEANSEINSIQTFNISDQTIINLGHNQQKLRWSGNKNQLYSVLRQLKNSDLIGNSYDELVEFLHENVIGFDGDKETTRRELKRDKELPKNKRVKIDLDQED